MKIYPLKIKQDISLKLESVYYRFVAKLERSLNFLRYDIPRGIRNLTVWFPIIWRDRNFDQFYLYEIMEKKLEQMERCFSTNEIRLHQNRTVREIKICRYILNRLKNDWYFEAAHDEISSRWGKTRMWGEPYTNSSCRLVFHNHKIITKKDEELHRKDYKRTQKKYEKIRKHDLELFAKIFTRHVETWWN